MADVFGASVNLTGLHNSNAVRTRPKGSSSADPWFCSSLRVVDDKKSAFVTCAPTNFSIPLSSWEFSTPFEIAPRQWSDLWQRFERGLSGLARRKTMSWIGLGAFVLAARAALLPIWPIPTPAIYDEFSYLLQADTFAHGRLANSAHPLWQFFESTYILQQPTYASRFPPGQALAMAVGQVLFGHPWFGVWLSAGLLAAALCWALQGWLPPGLGAFRSVHRFGSLSL